MLKASEDKTFPGAIVASLASPWGQAISAGDPANTYFGSYREVFARDLYEAWTGLLADGDLRPRATRRCSSSTAAAARRVDAAQQPRQRQDRARLVRDAARRGRVPDPDGGPARADRCASLYADHIKPAANFVVAHGPAFGVERWEEQSGYSPSTIAAEIAGLVAAADLARANGDTASAAVWLGVADDWQRSIKGWTVTTNGPLAGAPVLHPALEDRRPERGDLLQRRQRRPDARPARGDRRRLPRARPARRAAGERSRRRSQSLPVVDATIKSTTPSGPGLAPLQRRRLRRRGQRRPAVGAERPGDRATSGRCSPPSAPSSRRDRRRGDGAASLLEGMDAVRLRRRADPRAGLGAAGPRRVAVRHRPDGRVDRLRERRRRRARRRR